MAILEKAGEAVVTTVTKSPAILVGIGVAIAAPFIAPMLRPAVKGVVKAGLTATARSKEFVAEVGERWSDLVAEARAEVSSNGHKTEVTEIAVASEA